MFLVIVRSQGCLDGRVAGMKRYFDATVDGRRRIAVVEAPSEADVDAIFGPETPPELTADELPAGFEEWRRYRARQMGRAVVDIRSRDGD